MRKSLSNALLTSLIIASSSGCAGTQKEPQNPDTEPPPPEQVLGTPDTSDDVASTEKGRSPQEQTPTAESRSASPDDLQNALQVVLMDDALLGQLKLEEPGRFPLKIAGPDVPGSAAVQAHAKNVEVVTTPTDPEAEPVLIFTEISMNGNTGTFKYRFPIEGVRGTSYVTHAESGWVLERSRISQYGAGLQETEEE